MAPMWLLTVDISSETDEPFACSSGVLSPSSPAEPGTRCPLSGSCPRIAQRSWAFRRRGPADPAVRPALHLGAHAVSPARLQRVASALQPRRLACRRPGPSGRPARLHPVASGDIGKIGVTRPCPEKYFLVI